MHVMEEGTEQDRNSAEAALNKGYAARCFFVSLPVNLQVGKFQIIPANSSISMECFPHGKVLEFCDPD